MVECIESREIFELLLSLRECEETPESMESLVVKLSQEQLGKEFPEGKCIEWTAAGSSIVIACSRRILKYSRVFIICWFNESFLYTYIYVLHGVDSMPRSAICKLYDGGIPLLVHIFVNQF